MKCHDSRTVTVRFKLIVRTCEFILLLAFVLVSGCATSKPASQTQQSEYLVDVGTFSGNLDDAKELRALMARNGIDGGLEGSSPFTILVPASNAVLACKLLSKNELELRGKVHLYTR
jgi:hypothetical protein